MSQPNKLEEWRDALTGGEDREVTFTLLLTKRCGFACAHCMFAAGPRGEARWMPAGVLDEVLLAATTFRDWGFRTRLNLLGGEPTLDLERFALIHSHISHHPLSHDLEMEMTTNGWWLRSWKDTCRFAGASRRVKSALTSLSLPSKTSHLATLFTAAAAFLVSQCSAALTQGLRQVEPLVASITADIANAAVGVNGKSEFGCRAAEPILQAHFVLQRPPGRTEAIWFCPFGINANIAQFDSFNQQWDGVMPRLHHARVPGLVVFLLGHVAKDDKPAYHRLRDDYNAAPSAAKYFALTLCCNNNMARFNASFRFNQTFGRRTWNSSTTEKVSRYTAHIRPYRSRVHFLPSDFARVAIPHNSMVYVDPPYSNTEAGYNAYWRKDDDRRLFEHLLRLADGGQAIAVSGVLRHNGKECPLLNLLINAGWQTHLLHSDYSVVSKVGPKESQEVLLTNYRRLEMKPTEPCREPTQAVPA